MMLTEFSFFNIVWWMRMEGKVQAGSEVQLWATRQQKHTQLQAVYYKQ